MFPHLASLVRNQVAISERGQCEERQCEGGAINVVVLGLPTPIRGERFIPAFCFAVRNLRTDRATTMRLLRDHLADSGPTGKLIERVERGPFGVEPDDVRTWGTPVFYGRERADK